MESKKNKKETLSRGKFVDEHNYKHLSLKRIGMSVKFSWEGLKYAYLNEQSLSLHLACTAVVIVCGFGFKIAPIQWVIILVMMALILVAELFN
ncbi:MAG: diacylglycerol kinase, partial [Bacilli bacterium]